MHESNFMVFKNMQINMYSNHNNLFIIIFLNFTIIIINNFEIDSFIN